MTTMKKIGMFLAAAFVALASVSCNQSSDSNYATHGAYVRVIGTSPVTYQTDEGLTLTQAASQVTMPTLNYGDRMLIYYSEYESQQSYGGKYITLYGYYLFEDADTAILTAGEENTNGEQPVEVYANGSQYYLVHCTKQVLDVALLFHGTADKIAQHTFTLVLDEENPTTDEGYLNLQLCHATSAEEATVKTEVANFYTFDLAAFNSYMDGTKGVHITSKALRSTIPSEHKFDWPSLPSLN